MIDEKTLAERLADAASAQDNLLPRALNDDLAAGHRRLRRHRVLTGGGIVGGAAAVAVLAIGVSSWLTPNAEPLPGSPQVAGTTARPSPRSKPSTVQVAAQDAAFNRKMQGLLAKHFDPGRKHLTFESGPFEVSRDPGQHGTTGRAGWKIAGQKGEGVLKVSLLGSGTGSQCGEYEDLLPKCHSVPMPGGGTATMARLGDRAEIQYQQPDGESVFVSVQPLFGNNSTIPVHGMGITDAQLKAFVADSDLNLPPLSAEEQAVEQQLKDAAPTLVDVTKVAGRGLTGGTFDTDHVEEFAGNFLVAIDWKKASISATVEIGVDAKLMASKCLEQLSVPSCTPLTLPDGKKVEYHEGARSYQGGPTYVMGATYVQPDGDLASVRILYPGTKLPAGAATKAQVLAMVTDSALDK
ncbi:hypothetical protein OHA70_20615 [Kribbella sp. NBC_00382]|uniref:hypothetical protein n=1 Tax=Kribbella sp. NBC_00382 TaxID=2975967 RepID=UPI002E201CC4